MLALTVQLHNSVLDDKDIGIVDEAVIIPILSIPVPEDQVEPLKVVVTRLLTTTGAETVVVQVVLETEKVYVIPGTKPPIVAVAPVPVKLVKPAVFGLAIIVLEPVGKPLSCTLPVVTTHVG